MKSCLLLITFVLLSSLCFAQIPTNGLVAYYPFNGNANDESNNGWNGTVNGAILTSDKFGVQNRAYHFDNSSSNTITTQFPGILGSNPRTISFWQTSDNTTNSISMSYGAGNNNQSTQGCTFCIGARRINNNQVIAGVDLRFGGIAYLINDVGSDWHHYTIIVPTMSQPRTQDIKVYRDAQLLTNVYSMWGDVAINTLGNFYFIIGQFINSANFGGSLDAIRIYNRALSQSEITALFNEPPDAPLVLAPSNLTATALSHNQIKLTWKDNSNNEDSFYLERTTSGGQWVSVVTLPANTTTYTNDGLQSLTTYYYKVRAIKGTDSSVWSNTDHATTMKEKLTGIKGIVIETGNNNPIEGATVFLRSSTQVQDGSVLDNTITNSNGEFSFPTANRNYKFDESIQYSITVTKSGYKSFIGPMNPLVYWQNIRISLDPLITPPKNLRATEDCNDIKLVHLTWDHPSPSSVDGFRIERSPDGKTWSEIGNVGNNILMFDDPKADPGNNGIVFYYRVTAKKNNAYSSASTTQLRHFIDPPMLVKPVQAKLETNSYFGINLKWEILGACSIEITRVEVTGNIEKEGKTILLPSSDRVFTDASIEHGKLYYYKLRFCNPLKAPYTKCIGAITDKISTDVIFHPVEVTVYKGNTSEVAVGADVKFMTPTGWSFNVTTGPDGKATLTNVPSLGDIQIMAEMKVHTEPAFRHKTIEPDMYEIWADSDELKPDPNTSNKYFLEHAKYSKDINHGKLDIKILHPVFRYNLVVSIERDAKQKFFDRVERVFREASKILFDVSDGYAIFNRIIAFDKSVNRSDADIVIFDNVNPKPYPPKWNNNGPGVGGMYEAPLLGSGIFNSTGQIYITEEMPGSSYVSFASTDEEFNNNYVYLSQGIVHEFSHYAFKVWDEYINGSYLPLDFLKNNIVYPFVTGLMDRANYPTELSSSNFYSPIIIGIGINAWTMQYYRNYMQPCWTTLENLLNEHLRKVLGNANNYWLKVNQPSPGFYSGGNPKNVRMGPYENVGLPGKPNGFEPHDSFTNPKQDKLSSLEQNQIVKTNPLSNIGSYIDINSLLQTDILNSSITILFEGLQDSIISASLIGASNPESLSLSKLNNGKQQTQSNISIHDSSFNGMGYIQIVHQQNQIVDTFIAQFQLAYIGKGGYDSSNVILQPGGEGGLSFVIRNAMNDQIITTFSSLAPPYGSGQFVSITYPFGIRLSKQTDLTDSMFISVPFNGTLKGIDRTLLRLYQFDTTALIWNPIASSQVFPMSNTVWASVKSTGIFCVFAPAFSNDFTPPAQIQDLIATTDSTRGAVILSFTSVGDDSLSGTALKYIIKYSENDISDENWDSLKTLPQYTLPKSSGQSELISFTMPEENKLYTFAIKVIDKSGNESLISNTATAVTGRDIIPNRSPKFMVALSDTIILENKLLEIPVYAFDPDIDPLVFSAMNLPQGATFDSTSYSVRTFHWTPAFGTAGPYNNIMFIVSDGSLSDTLHFNITVKKQNRSPKITSIVRDTTINENQNLQITFAATDPDNDQLTFSSSNLPAGATFKQQINNADFIWTPTYEQAGTYSNILVKVNDGLASDSVRFNIIVSNVNRSPLAFRLISPRDNFVIKADSAKQSPPISLLWYVSHDPDKEDTVRYECHIWKPSNYDKKLTAIFDTTFSFVEAFREKGLYNWEVVASDGKVSVSDSSSFLIEFNPTTDVKDKLVNKSFELYQNYPNPYGTATLAGNPTTSIRYSLEKESSVSLSVLNLLGIEVARLVNNETQEAGLHQVSFHADHLPSGMYLYRLQAGRFVETKRMIVIK